MYCKNCGQKLDEGAKFCKNCGTSVDNAIKEAHSILTSAQTSASKDQIDHFIDSVQKNNELPKTKNSSVAVGLVFVFLLLVGLFVVFLIYKDIANTTASTNTAGNITPTIESQSGSSESPTPSSASNPVTDVQPNVKVNASTVPVSTFYNGQYGFSLSIPSGNTSTCTWTWAGGNADIPYTQTTYANTATEKHIITLGPDPVQGQEYNFKVTCIDDFGNQYTGVFPSGY